ncbi:MAG: hypothetical protein IJ735_02740 [Clostridia bacterium]|nr:hypothetical protein [Clostridia bacterium]
MTEKKKRVRKKLTKKQVAIIVTVIVTILLTFVWGTLAYINVNRVESVGIEYGKGTRYIAHRGWSNKYFQNTTEAFLAAANEDFFQGIETDVWRTKDGVFVCAHDATPFRDKGVSINEKTYAEIKDLPLDLSDDCGADVTLPYRIATLEEYLSIVSGTNKYAFVEIKQKFSEAEARELVDLCYRINGRNRTYFCSFHKKIIDYISSYEPFARTELFASWFLPAFVYTEAGYNVGLHTHLFATDAFVKATKRKDSFSCVWTVNDKATADRLASYGIDWITTDGVL